MKAEEELIFALDIGTRTIVGLVMEYNNSKYKIIASKVIEHESRAMLDGQIHNVQEVSKQVKKVKDSLEEELDIELKKVSIAAAGRALKTVIIENSMQLNGSKIIDNKNVKTLEFSAIQKAKERLAGEDEENNIKYNFVGYSVIEYYLDGVYLRDLIGQKGQELKAKLVVTFLPRIVVDSLLSVINQIDLEVEYLTLEPIAAADVVIPQKMLTFNLALIDIGAGTSDIAITKGGSMIGYDMVPVAGDEITEILAEHYLLDYDSAEKAKRLLKGKEEINMKTILGNEIVINTRQAQNIIKPQVEKMVSLITQKIIKINGKSPQAVLCIGGGSLTPLLIDELSSQMELDEDRVGIKDSEDLKNIVGEIEGINGSQSLTPIGIAYNSYKNKAGSNFYNVRVNDNPVQIFSIKNPTLSEALLAANVNIKKIRPATGMGLTFTINGQLKTVKGTIGKPGNVYLNGEKVDLDEDIESGDEIKFEPGEAGEDARAKIEDVISQEVLSFQKISIDGQEQEIKTNFFQNGKPVDLKSPVVDGADINYNSISTIKEAVMQVKGINPEQIKNEYIHFTVNGEQRKLSKSKYIIKQGNEILNPDKPLAENMKLQVEENKLDFSISRLISKISDEITIIFNNNQLNIPCEITTIRVNAKEVEEDYELKNGDKIEIKFHKMTVNSVLEFINYNLSSELKEKATLEINKEQADFNNYIYDGDKIDLRFEKFNDRKVK